jgi:aminoglycoside phosphotransferase (APT) family kinase protein
MRLDVPEPVEAGVASDAFPWPWSVVRWISGASADDAPLSPADAELLADDLRALHREAGSQAPTNPHRGVPLQERHDVVVERLRRLGLGALERVWMEALEAPGADRSVWIHGALHPRNVIVSGGEIAGLIDWGDIAGGDAATDLACAWTLFDADGRSAFLEAYEVNDAERVRALGWAVVFASALLDSGDPVHVAVGRCIERRIAAP